MSFRPIYKLRDWINPELLVRNNLLNNPAALHISEKILDEMNDSTHYSEVLDKNCLNSREFQQNLENFKFNKKRSENSKLTIF